jgi:hypothetical protein
MRNRPLTDGEAVGFILGHFICGAETRERFHDLMEKNENDKQNSDQD